MNEYPKTREEMLRLPPGPSIGFNVIEYTDEDRERGYLMVDGKRVNVVVGCAKVMIPVMPKVKATWVEETAAVGFVDDDGIAWLVGQYEDGSFFKSRRSA